MSLYSSRLKPREQDELSKNMEFKKCVKLSLLKLQSKNCRKDIPNEAFSPLQYFVSGVFKETICASYKKMNFHTDQDTELATLDGLYWDQNSKMSVIQPRMALSYPISWGYIWLKLRINRGF